MADLVTGEAVVLELRVARLASRALSIAIDAAVQLLAILLVTLLLGGVLTIVDNALAAAIGLVAYITILLGYPVTMETLTRGRTLGKLALGLRVVRDDGGAIRFRHALLRGLVGIVEFWVTGGAIALITSLVSARGKRLGDVVAGTVVVRDRLPRHPGGISGIGGLGGIGGISGRNGRSSPGGSAGSAGAVGMPAPLAGWAAAADLARLPDDLALAARQYLARAGQLSPEARDGMGRSLASAVAGYVSPPAPPGTPAFAYLAAVLAERRRRESARLQAGGAAVSGADKSWPPPPAPPPPPPSAVRDGPPGGGGSGFAPPS